MSKLKVGIIGCGRITDMHAPGYLNHPSARIYAVCDIRPEVAEARARQWNAERFYTDYRQLLADPAVQLVEIITPHHLHKQICLEACQAGKHVSVQKPMAMNILECDAMIAAARDSGVKLKVFENFVFYPPYVKARELIQDGSIGEPLSIRFKLASGQGGWKVPLNTWVWRLQEATGGGGPQIFDDGYHKFSVARHLLGPVELVTAWIDRSFGVIDTPAMISWQHKEGGRVGYLEGSHSQFMTIRSKYYAVDERVEVVGTEGIIWVTRCTAQFLNEPPLILYRQGQVHTFDHIRADWLDSFTDSTAHFVHCILEGGDPLLTGERGREVMQFALAALESARLGQAVRPDNILA